MSGCAWLLVRLNVCDESIALTVPDPTTPEAYYALRGSLLRRFTNDAVVAEHQ